MTQIVDTISGVLCLLLQEHPLKTRKYDLLRIPQQLVARPMRKVESTAGLTTKTYAVDWSGGGEWNYCVLDYRRPFSPDVTIAVWEGLKRLDELYPGWTKTPRDPQVEFLFRMIFQ